MIASGPMIPRGTFRFGALLAALMLTTAACNALTPQTPPATPTDFAGIVAELASGGIGVENVTSGDAGCDDQRLARTAISFDAEGIDQPSLVRVYLYAFKTAAVYDELRASVDACARTYATDPATFSSVESPPYVLAGAGPWHAGFKDALRKALDRAAVGRLTYTLRASRC